MVTKIESLQFKVPFEGKPERPIEVIAYAFDRQGKFLTSAPVREGQTQLQLETDQAKRAHIFFAPSVEGRRKHTPTLEMMERLHAYEPKWSFDHKNPIYELLPIPEYLWKWWWWCKCRVRGRVVKPVTINGVTQDMPVCHAHVHVCEVDKLLLIIPRLPDDIIFRLRDELIRVIERPFPHPPLPDPPPFRYDPGVIDPIPEKIAKLNQPLQSERALGLFDRIGSVMLNPQPLPPGEIRSSLRSRLDVVALNPQPEPPGPPELLSSALPLQAKAALSSPSLSMVKETLLANVHLILPYLCWWPWLWPFFYTCEEIAVLETDTQGRFDSNIWYLCFGDHPDLYFWVEFCIGGTWTKVYHPPIRCHTYWNYACGSEVTIRITDPRVPWCGDPHSMPGKQVAVMLIGNDVSLHEIQGVSAGVNEGLTTAGEPFGGSLEPHVWFGDDLITAGITHYRWSYRRLTLGNGITLVGDSWHAMDRWVVRHYAVIDPTPPDYPLTFKPLLLGPDPAFPTQNLFKIQPKDSPAGSYGWAPMVDARENTASAFFLSHLLEGGDALAAAGKYELKLELFDNAGNLVNLTDSGILLKVPTIDGPFGPGTVPTKLASSEHLILDGASKIIGFRMVLRVDNNPCQAEIYDTSVNSVTGGPCGFISYPPGADAHVSFKARHPHNFARFNFTIVKGSSGYLNVACAPFDPTVAWTSLPLVSDSPVNGYTRNPAGIFSKDVPVSNLVGTCPGGKAAFGENLSVYALAIDGWTRLWYLDSYGLPKAFALTPAPAIIEAKTSLGG